MLPAICILLVFPYVCAMLQTESRIEDTRKRCPCGSISNSVQSRVVGGHAAGRGLFPYASDLLGVYRGEVNADVPFCGGTLITDRHVLTAAHCLRNESPERIVVDVGDYSLHDRRDGQFIRTRSLSMFPEYSSRKFHTDIGIVELATPVRFNSTRTAVLPPHDLDLQPGTRVSVYGWGRLTYGGGRPDVLQDVTLPVWNNDECQRKFHSFIEPSMICAGGEPDKDACLGDSGSGLVVRLDNEYVLCGVVSFGRKCGLPHVPGVYTKVSSYMDWILEKTRTANCRPCIYGDE
uniref:limulus clotting factor C n=1 Tax=Deinopis subrufa TaxID=1905329 RepID=A0A4Q8K912_DEISU